MKEIWAIGGGKGGIGKSFIISSMGKYIARRGKKVILVNADLGAGVHFNTIDTFFLADRKIVVIVPEITAIENMYGFIKIIIFRHIMNTLGRNGFKDEFREVWDMRQAHGITTLKVFVEYLRSRSASMGHIIDRELAGFRVNIVLNQIRLKREKRIGNSVKSICLKYFGLDARYAGFIETDDFITRSLNNRQPYLQSYPESMCSTGQPSSGSGKKWVSLWTTLPWSPKFSCST